MGLDLPLLFPLTQKFTGLMTPGQQMYRKGDAFDGISFLRIGTVDDFALHETKLRPQVEQFVKERVNWFSGVENAQKFDGMAEF